MNRERWLVSYADFITLLFGFFVVMYSVSHVSQEKYQSLAETLSAAFPSQNRPQDAFVEPSNNESSSLDPVEAENSTQQTESMLEVVSHALENVESLSTQMPVKQSGDFIEVTLDAALLFGSGQAELNEEARSLLAPLVPILKAVSDTIEVSGHTDNQPINNARFSSNWALSSARAVAVVDALMDLGVTPSRMKAVGFGEYQPVEDNGTAAGRSQNRRVVLRFSRKLQAGMSADHFMNEQPEDSGPSSENETSVTLSSEESPTLNMESPKTTIGPNIPPVIIKESGLLFTNDPEPPSASGNVNE